LIWIGIALLVLELIGTFEPRGPQGITVPYTTFRDQVQSGNVTAIQTSGEQITATLKHPITAPPAPTPPQPPAAPGTPNGSAPPGHGPQASGSAPQSSSTLITDRPPFPDPGLMSLLLSKNVTVTSHPPSHSWVPGLLIAVLPAILILAWLWYIMGRQGAGVSRRGGIFGLGRSPARARAQGGPRVTFADVAGEEEAKAALSDVVNFLRDPRPFRKLGARIPKGVLLVGPPGTGKTLLARAVAGEARSAFFYASATEFVEMFVGVGAARVRDLFRQAKASAPAIVFLDEIDAVGRRRSVGIGPGNEEREQTLNQLLGEMDGFEPKAGVVVLAATNRPDVLDRALLRPGRFDRQVTVGLPDRPAREAILKIHSRQVPLADDVDLQALARETPGFSGADLANLVNQAAIQAAHRKADRVSRADFENALDQLVMGGLTGAVMSDTERRVVAYHEAGHALAAVLSPEADPVRKVSIVPRGRALGATRQVPIDEHHNYSRHYLFVRLVVLLGGRTAEELVFHECTTGAEDDLRQATGLARQMVARWGMSTAIGPVAVESGEQQASPGAAPWMGTRNWSEATAALIDRETEGLIARAHDRATMLQKEHREALDRLAEALMREETLDVQELAGVLRKAGVEPVAGSQDRSAPRVSGPAPVPAPVSQGTAATTRPE
jgi:cell division protease FtsH